MQTFMLHCVAVNSFAKLVLGPNKIEANRLSGHDQTAALANDQKRGGSVRTPPFRAEWRTPSMKTDAREASAHCAQCMRIMPANA